MLPFLGSLVESLSISFPELFKFINKKNLQGEMSNGKN
ncbi:hypothetical protein SDC9_126986 [bioreactor metagenome]|uniref:Uncharacterized protein n=1 Tax=bioreactor metagenome TaxID=1076179 RepID=A0A645CSQ3_9ZZZZ